MTTPLESLEARYELALEWLDYQAAVLAPLIRRLCPQFAVLHMGVSDLELVQAAIAEFGTAGLLDEMGHPGPTPSLLDLLP